MNQIEKSPYKSQFEEIQSLIEFRRNRAYQAVNNESIISNWEVGCYVSRKLKTAQWGSKIVSQLAIYLKEKQPEIKGYDKRAIERMVKFYDTYCQPEFAAALPPQIQTNENHTDKIVVTALPQLQDTYQNIPIAAAMLPQLENEVILPFLATISWTSHLEILSGCTSHEERIFYILLCNNERLTYRELKRQIEAGIFERTMLGNTKQSLIFRKIYPTASRFFKDDYMVDFLNLPDSHSEKSLQQGLVEQMKKFILDLGKDFIFMGNEYLVQVGMNDFRIDLLFFHRGLQCLAAVELKTTKFKPEYLGQLDFYLEALDRDVKRENENPSIGILLCKSADSEVVEYALSRSLSPTMIAKYKRQLIPKELLQKQLQEYYENSTAK
jgi:predicted nuclease of restriction endonuclease-like (RecB) superfamily